MKYKITDMANFTKAFLNEDINGSIHSVYHKTINLLFGNQLIALQSKGSVISPISLITDLEETDFSSLHLFKGDKASIQNQCLILQGGNQTYSFDFAQAQLAFTKLDHQLSKEASSRLANIIKKTLAAVTTEGFSRILNQQDFGDYTLILTAAKNRIEESISLYQVEDYASSAESFSKLVGLGIGLTPSGDDFLCGMLAGLHFRGMTDSIFGSALRSSISDHLQDTLDVSAAFLQCALIQEFSMPVCQLPFMSSPEDLHQLFSSIGHSSGMDTLYGIYCALTL